MWARGAVLALLLCGACVDGRSVGYPDELPEGTRALLLRVDLDGLGWAMFLRPDAPPTSIAVPTEGDLWMLALPFTPTDLLLEWEVPLRDVGASGGAALPPPLASFRRAPDEPWVQAEPPARPFFLPHVTFAACSAVGGCLTESDGLIQCLEPCPIPTVTPPAPPSRACPEGWGSRELEDAVFCAPPLEARAACGEGERQPVGGEACASVSTCAAGPWPDAEGGERGWYVRGGAVGGDGTPLDPYGTLAEAVAAARDGDQILLGAGTIPAAVEVARSVRIAGLCPRDSTLVGPMRVTGDVRMRDLRVVSERGPGLEVAAGGALELVGAVVEATEVAVRVQGTLRLGPALVSAPVALDAAGDVALEAVSTQGNLRCTGGLLVADDLVATATSTIADLNGCTRAAFSRVRFEGGRLGVVSTRPVVVGIEDATFVQQSGVGVALEIPGELPGTLTATRVSFVGGGRGILLRGVDAQLSDVHSEGLAGSTLDVNVPGDVPESHQAVVARGVWVEGSAVPLVRSSRDAGDRRRLSMTLTDAVLHGTSTAHPLDGLLPPRGPVR